MSKSSRINGFPAAEEVCRYGTAEGRPREKRRKTFESFSRISGLVQNGQTADGVEIGTSELQDLHRIMLNRLLRLNQLAGGQEEINARHNKHRVDMLRRSNKAKILHLDEIENPD